MQDITPPKIEQLKNRIKEMERTRSRSQAISFKDVDPRMTDDGTAWTLSQPSFETAANQHLSGKHLHQRHLLGRHLEAAAVHEIKPDYTSSPEKDWASAWTAARSFTLALAGRWLQTCGSSKQNADILWCTSAMMTSEFGALYGPGLTAFGLDPSRIIVVEAARQQDALWALEQGLRSGCLALAIAQLDEIDLTPARRLALAATSSSTPCLAITHPRSPATAATATRWRIAPAPSSVHPFDPIAPGAPRFAVTLERCRSRSSSANARPFLLDQPVLLEWCNAAYRFSLVPFVANRTDETGHSVEPRHTTATF